MIANSLFSKSPSPASQADPYSFPPVLQSFLSTKPVTGIASTINSDRVPLITDPSGSDPTSSFSTSFFSHRSFNSAPTDVEPEAFRGLSHRQRIIYFGIAVLCASLFFSFALIFVPLLATPSGMRKFVFMYILGNIALVCAFAFAYGPWTYAKGLLARDRLPSNAAYFFSLFFGIYGVLWWRSAVCALLAVVIQVGLGAWYLKNFIWSGTKIFSFMSKATSLATGGSSSLPIWLLGC